eukprot:6492788-Amphidinium_carterae.4
MGSGTCILSEKRSLQLAQRESVRLWQLNHLGTMCDKHITSNPLINSLLLVVFLLHDKHAGRART